MSDDVKEVVRPRAVSRTNITQLFRTTTPNSPPASNSLLEGELAIELATPMRLWVGVPTSLDPTGRKLVLDSGGSGLADAPSDGAAYGRLNAAWRPVLPLTGGTLAGLLTLAVDPTNPLDAVTKRYADGHYAVGTPGGYLARSGGTMTGPLVLAADPAAPMQAVTKQYADATYAPGSGGSYLPLAGGSITGSLFIDPGNLLIGTALDSGYRLDVNAAAGGARIIVTAGTMPLAIQAPGAFTPPANPANALLQLVGAQNANPAITIDAAGTTGAGGAPVLTGRSWNSVASVGSPANQGLLNVRGFGWDGAAYSANPRVLISLITAQLWTSANQGTAISFQTTPLNSIITSEVARFAPSGGLLIGTATDAGYKLDVLSTAANSRFSVTPGTTALVLHGNVTAPPTMFANTALQIVGATTGIVRQEMVGFAGQSYLTLRRSEGTASAPAATGNAVGFGGIQAAGHTGAAWSSGSNAAITFISGGLWSPTSTPTIIAFTTTAIGVTTNAEAMRIAPSGNLLIGTAIDGAYRLDMVGGAGRLDAGLGGVFPASVTAGALIVGAADAAQPIVSIAGFGGPSNNIGKPIFQLYRANGTRAAPSAVQSGNNLAAINVFGYGATTFGGNSAAINFVAAETFTDAAHGTAIGFSTTPTGSIVSSEAARFSPSGNLLIGTLTDGAYKIDMVGNARFTGTLNVADPTAAGMAVTRQYADAHYDAIGAAAAGVTAWNTRTGAVTLSNADVIAVLPGSSSLPVMNGAALAGTGTTWARSDHVHPTDTSLYPNTNPAGYQTAAQVTASLASYLPLAGGTLTGNLIVNPGHVLIGTAVDSGFLLDVNATAAGARISVTAQALPFVIDAGPGGVATPGVTLGGTGVVVRGADGAGSRLTVDGFGGTGQLTLRSTGGTRATPTALAVNAAIGTITFYGYGATGYSANQRALVGAMADENWTDTAQGSRMAFRTTLNGGVANAVTRLAITNAGNILIGGGLETSALSQTVQVTGTGLFTGTLDCADPAAATQAVTRQFGDGRYASLGSGVLSFNTRTGAITLAAADVSGATGLLTTGGAMSGGLGFGSAVAPGGVTDLSRHLALYSTTYGLSVTGGRLNHVVGSGSSHVMVVNGVDIGSFNSGGLTTTVPMLAVGDESASPASSSWVTRMAGQVASPGVGDADQTYTPANVGYRVINWNGALTADRTITMPVTQNYRTWVLRNATTGGFNLIVKGSSQGVMTIPPGQEVEVWCNGAGFYGLQNMWTFSPFRFGDGTVNSLIITTPVNLTGAITLGVSGTGALQFLASPTAPTPAAGNNSTLLATTAFVTTAFAGTRGFGLTAAGTTQATATLVTNAISEFTTVPAGAGWRLPPGAANADYFMMNAGANDGLLYPATGQQFEGYAVNAPITVTAGYGAARAIWNGTLWRIR